MEKYIQSMTDHWSKLLITLLVVMGTQQGHGSDYVSITLLENAVPQGAVCLDGSSPAYYYDKGFGDGVDNWLIHLEGGGWCGSDAGCGFRKTQYTGSSKYTNASIEFNTILGDNQTINPDFYNWNRVFVTYCDGSSYMGDVEEVDGNTNIFRRGARIFNAIMEDLLAKGMANAKNAILAGGSAGGLATILHCDGFRALIPNASRVKCISDSGFFIHAENLYGADLRANYFANMVAYHEITKSLPQSCTSKVNGSLCIFPENIVRDIQTPLFILESAFDEFQLSHNNVSDDPNWRNCTANLKACTPSQLRSMKDFRNAFIEILQQVGDSPSTGMFVHSCYRHGHFYESEGWDKSPVLGNKTIAMAIGDWYFDRSSFKEIDIENELPLTRQCTPIA